MWLSRTSRIPSSGATPRRSSSPKRLSENSVSSYLSDLLFFADYLAAQNPPLTLETMTEESILGYLDERQKAQFSVTSTMRTVSAIRSFCKFRKSHGYTDRNPADTVKSIRRPRRLPSDLSEDDVERLLDAPDTKDPVELRDRAMLEVLYSSGLRVSSSSASPGAMSISRRDSSASSARGTRRG